MDFLIIFSKGLLFIILNILLGYLFCYVIHKLLFYPKKVYLFGKYPLSFTPGFVHRKKKKLIDYLHGKLKDYLLYAESDESERNFLTDFEKKIYKELIPVIKRTFFTNWIPKVVRDFFDGLLEDISWHFIRKLTRMIIPRLVVEFKLHKQIDLLDLKLNVYELEKYFNEYVYSFMMTFVLVSLGVVGIFNAILYWILM